MSGPAGHGDGARPSDERTTGRPPGPGDLARPRGRPLLTWADRVVLYTLVGLGVVLLIVPAGSGEAGRFRIERAGDVAMTLPLNVDMDYEVPGPLGTTVVRVRDGAVSIIESPCTHRICVAMGAARKPGAVIVCVPNEVVVRVLGESGEGHDALTR